MNKEKMQSLMRYKQKHLDRLNDIKSGMVPPKKGRNRSTPMYISYLQREIDMVTKTLDKMLLGDK